MTASTTYLLLIRHGENDWVGTNRLAGRTTGVHLNDKGREQSARLVELLEINLSAPSIPVPLERCLQTAEPVAAALGSRLSQKQE